MSIIWAADKYENSVAESKICSEAFITCRRRITLILNSLPPLKSLPVSANKSFKFLPDPPFDD